MSTAEEQIRKMYEGQLTSQKEQLQQDYTQADADLTTQKEKLQKATDENLRRTAVNAQISTMNNERYNAANGLSSGAQAQARLSLENQAQANLTALRTAQQEADAEVERQRSILSQGYASAIRKAQADNDLALAQALYAEAEKAEAELLAKQEAAANLMAQTGDYTRLGALYGLSDAEIKKLGGARSGSTGKKTQNWDNGSVNKDDIIKMQNALGVNADGKWGPKTRQKAYELWGTPDPDNALVKMTEIYNSVLQNYITKKKEGEEQAWLDARLRESAKEHGLSIDQITEIRDTRY